MNARSNGVLADTSVWIEFFRTDSKTGARFSSLLTEKPVWVCGIVMFELLQGIKSEAEKAEIQSAIAGLPYAEMSPLLWERAAELSRSLKKSGLTVPLSDIFIASVAIEYNLSIFTLDKHFEQIPGVKLYR
ncbi:MAG: PIN domain nuclease [Nitrospirae bacterium]|nr:MAG: PIN domain nuclease [Nitrospirota bacterium]